MGTADPSEVKGKIYPPAGAIPGSPPSDAITGKMNPDITVEYCDTFILNFAFHAKYNNEILGADHGPLPNGKGNRIAVWAKDGSTWHLGTPVQPFFGITSTTTECGDAPSGAGGSPFAALELSGLGKYRVTSHGPYPPAGETLVMIRTGPEFGPVLSWKSCSKASPAAEWKLWVNVLDGEPFGTLALHSTNGNRLDVPLIWKCADWHPTGENHFTLSSPQYSPHIGSVAICKPA